MKPLSLFQILNDVRLDLKEIIALEIISTYKEPELTQVLVADCRMNKISSPATSYKYIMRLKRRRFIEDVDVKGADKRIHYIQITNKGREFLAKVSA